MVQGGLTCKECGGEEIYALIWCWQHKCGIGKIKNNSRLIAPKCQRLAKEAQAKLFWLHRQVIEGDTETGGDCFLADEVWRLEIGHWRYQPSRYYVYIDRHAGLFLILVRCWIVLLYIQYDAGQIIQQIFSLREYRLFMILIIIFAMLYVQLSHFGCHKIY